MSLDVHKLQADIVANASGFKEGCNEAISQAKETKAKIQDQIGNIEVPELPSDLAANLSENNVISRLGVLSKNYKSELKALKAEYEGLSDTEKASGTGAAMRSRIDSTREAIRGIEQMRSTLVKILPLRSLIANLGDAAKRKIGDGFSAAAQHVKSFIASNARASAAANKLKIVAGALSGTFKSLGLAGTVAGKVIGASLKGTAKIAGLLGRGIKGIAEHLKSARAGKHGALSGLGNLTGQISRLLVSLFGLRAAFRFAKEGMGDLAQHSDSTNQALSSLKSATTQLKGSFAAAFAPILEFVAPVLNHLIGLLSSAANALAKFFSALTGKSYAIVATKSQQDYAASVSGAGSALDSAKESADAYKKSLMGFDQIHKLDEPTKGHSGGSGSGGGGAGGAGGSFEMVEVGETKSWAEKFKEMWKTADFTPLGDIVGNKINEALEKIPWAKIKETSGKIGKSIATFLNGAIRTTDFDLVGHTIAEGLNTGFEFGYQFSKNFNWRKFGEQIGTGINGFFRDFDWAKTGKTISNFVAGGIETLVTTIETTDWKQVGESVKTMLQNIDWGRIVRAVFRGIGAALGGLAGFVWGLVEEAWNSVAEWWYDVAFDSGEFTIKGLLKGIGEAILGIGTWIKENIWIPFKEGFWKALGIKGESAKEMEPPGEAMVEGLKAGANRKFQGFLKWIGLFPKESRRALGNAEEWLKEKGEGSVRGLQAGFEREKRSSLLPALGNLRNETNSQIGDLSPHVRHRGMSIISGLALGYSASKEGLLLSSVRQIGSETTKAIGNLAPGTKRRGSEITSGLKSGFNEGMPSFKSAVSGVAGAVQRGIGSLYSVGKSAIRSFRDGFTSMHIPTPHIDHSWDRVGVGKGSLRVPRFNVRWYAAGGFPEEGPFYMNRGEIAGKFSNGKSVVANNQQITEGISEAVYRAFMRAGGSSGGMSDRKFEQGVRYIVDALNALHLYVGDEEIAKANARGTAKIDRRFNPVAIG